MYKFPIASQQDGSSTLPSSTKKYQLLMLQIMKPKVIAKGLMEQAKSIPIYTQTFKETFLKELKEIERNESKSNRDR